MDRSKTMRSMDDGELLRAHVETRSEAAFAELAGRHLNWVYSTARRIVRDPHLAEDVTQSGFVLLARQTREAWRWAKFKLAAGLVALSGTCLCVVVQGGHLPVTPAAARTLAAASVRAAPSGSRNAPSSSQASGERLGAQFPRECGAETVCALFGPVYSVLVQSDGRIVICSHGITEFVSPATGSFGTMIGTITRYDSEGSLDLSFVSAATPPQYAEHLAAMPDGRLFMVGPFISSVEGKPRPGLAMLLPDGKLDSSFIPFRGETNVDHLIGGWATIASDGKVWVSSKRSIPDWRVCQLEADGSIGEVRRFSVGRTGMPHPAMLGQMGFQGLVAVRLPSGRPGWTLGALPATELAQALQTCFTQIPLELDRYAVRLPDGGAILLVREGDIGRLMRFDKDWQPDFSYTNSLRARWHLSLALQRDGQLLVARGSELHDLDGSDLGSVVRLKRDGSVDRSFHCETDERVLCLAVQADGRVIIGGWFRKVNGVESPSLARLQPNGALDEDFRRHFTTPMGVFALHRIPVRAIAGASPPQAGASASRQLPRGPGQGGASPPQAEASASPGRKSGLPQTSPVSFILILSLQVDGGAATIQFQGAPGRTYILQASERLDGAAWANVSTNQTDASGIGRFRDDRATHSPARFYRVASQF